MNDQDLSIVDYQDCWPSNDDTFIYWNELPIELHGENKSWLSQTDLRILGHTNKLEYHRLHHLNTQTVDDRLLQAIRDGNY